MLKDTNVTVSDKLKKNKKLRENLVVGKSVFLLAERLKKDVPGVFYKSTTENKPFFNRDEIFFIRRIVSIHNSYNSYGFQKQLTVK